MGSLRSSYDSKQDEELMELTLQLRNRKECDEKYAKFRGDSLIGNPVVPKVGLWGDLAAICQPKNWPTLKRTVDGLIKGNGLDGQSLATIAGSLSDYSTNRQTLIDGQVKDKYDKMLHPPLTYLGDAFQYRTADGKFNSVLHPHLGQAGAPYAKTVPSKTHPLGALPDPADLFDKLMAREEGGRQSESGLSSMLIYHATIIIHDIFRTNDNDKNISDSSSYLDLSPLYGYTTEMQRKVRDGKYKLGLLKPDTFAEDRLLRQPPGVCIMLVMYNRYHNYAARQLLRINENGRFSVPKKYEKTKLVSLVKHVRAVNGTNSDTKFKDLCDKYEKVWREYQAAKSDEADTAEFDNSRVGQELKDLTNALEGLLKKENVDQDTREAFEASWEAAWAKQDDDLFNTARLITCGMYIQISVHDYLRALMGFHQFDTNFTLDPRADFDQKKTSRGTGNQVTVEFNLLYRFHCAISARDEAYTLDFMKKEMYFDHPEDTSLPEFLKHMKDLAEAAEEEAKKPGGKKPPQPWEVTFGIKNDETTGKKTKFERNHITNLFDDKQMLDALTAAMDDPISNFGPRNVPRCLKPVEIMGIIQARKWGVGTLNDFRDFFGMSRHQTFESVTKNVEIQNALRDLYEHPDMIELYPGIFCESDEYMGLDPGPKQSNSALWTAIFSDAITLVRSDRFYTVDWNTNSLTSWGMKEVTPDNETCKSSVFHRLIQRAFPGWFHYDSIRFFHPFYTAKQNAIYAEAQGYGPQFRETKLPTDDVQAEPPKKPEKPRYLDTFKAIYDVLNKNEGNFINPALSHRENLPKAMAEVLDDDQKDPTLPPDTIDTYVSSTEKNLKKYLDDLMRYMVKRESVAMTNSTFQIDVTKDFAIPVVTRYVADFLGFGDKLRTVAGESNTYTENEIYQHITNCQVFLTYNGDETKRLKRRNAFKASMAFLMDLTQRGNIFQARQWGIMAALFGKKQSNAMSELGLFVAKQVLDYEKDQAKAAAILLLVCLDFAYNAVASFTAALDGFMGELYEAAYRTGSEPKAKQPKWITVQELVFTIDPDNEDNKLYKKLEEELEKMIRVASQAKARTPIVRETVPQTPGAKPVTFILDLSKATAEALKANKLDEVIFLDSQLGLADKFGVFLPERFSVLGLTSMVKFIAQMKNPRRGHEAQGRLKRVRLDSTSEGYSNYMAPMRVSRIEQQVNNLPEGHRDRGIFTRKILRPEVLTYLTPTWDEMIPYPMTWKLRFDGFGSSDYSTDSGPYGRLASPWLPDDIPPFYQPQGVSRTGGTFAGVVCICAAGKAEADADAAHVLNGVGSVNGAVNGAVNGERHEHESHCPCLGQPKKKSLHNTIQLSTGCGMGDSKMVA